MKKLLVPLILALFGTGAGVGAGVFLRPDPPPDSAEAHAGAAPAKPAAKDGAEEPSFDYVKMTNQFVIPIVKGDAVAALVVLTLSLEVELGQQAAVFKLEPKLRDSFLQVMFDHANIGGFDGEFTDPTNLNVLRRELLSVARRDAGDVVNNVLILEIARQDY